MPEVVDPNNRQIGFGWVGFSISRRLDHASPQQCQTRTDRDLLDKGNDVGIVEAMILKSASKSISGNRINASWSAESRARRWRRFGPHFRCSMNTGLDLIFRLHPVLDLCPR